jgi:hypothetical protein
MVTPPFIRIGAICITDFFGLALAIDAQLF